MIITRLREEEKQRKEYNKIGSGNHWKNHNTIPRVPKLTTSSSSKSTHNTCRPQSDELDNLITNTPSKEHFKKKQKSSSNNEYIKFDEKMSYGEAVNLIHNSILSL